MRNKLIRWIVINQHPFTIVEEPSFIELVHSLCSNTELFSANIIKRKIMELYNGNIFQIQKFLQETPEELSFTMDI